MTNCLLSFDCVLVDSERIATGVLIDDIRAAGAQIDDHAAYTRFPGCSDGTVFAILRAEFDMHLTQSELALMQERLYERLRGKVGGNERVCSHAVLSDLEPAVTGLEPDACFKDMYTLPSLIAEFDVRPGSSHRAVTIPAGETG